MPIVAAHEPQQRRFESVVIAIANGLQAGRLGDRAADFLERAAQPILGFARGRDGAERFDFLDQSVDLAVAIKRLVLPR